MPQLEWENLASLLSLISAIATLLLLFFQAIPTRFLEFAESRVRRLARHRLLCFLLLPAMSLAVNFAIALQNGVPTPKIHDEYSYLLAADTFSHGRLTNPTPFDPKCFETPQELVTPTRMSKYPPGQGIALMLGQLACGEPIVGTWIITAAACATIYWMMLAFLPPHWALAGGAMAALHPTLLDWSQTYWGGSVAVLGGALVIGAWGRLMRGVSHISAMWLGIGLVILANSRPFEGLMLTVPLMLALVVHTRMTRSLPLFSLCGILLSGAIAMAYYNFRITGHLFRLPYVEYISQYAVYPLFWFQALRAVPAYHNPSMRWVHTVLDRYDYNSMRHFSTAWPVVFSRVEQFIMRNIKLGILLPPLVIGIAVMQDKRVKWVLAAVVSVLIGILAEVVALPHYSAPATAAIFMLVILGCQRLRQYQFGHRPIGVISTRAIGIGLCFGIIVSAAQGVSQDSRIVNQQVLMNLEPSLARERHLIFVEYLPGYQMGNEFVYNGAEIEQNRVIWVHSFGAAEDAGVAAHFAKRHVWLLTAGKELHLKVYRP